MWIDLGFLLFSAYQYFLSTFPPFCQRGKPTSTLQEEGRGCVCPGLSHTNRLIPKFQLIEKKELAPLQELNEGILSPSDK